MDLNNEKVINMINKSGLDVKRKKLYLIQIKESDYYCYAWAHTWKEALKWAFVKNSEMMELMENNGVRGVELFDENQPVFATFLADKGWVS